jgi:hypothetical protein
MKLTLMPKVDLQLARVEDLESLAAAVGKDRKYVAEATEAYGKVIVRVLKDGNEIACRMVE